ncbi:MAG: FAD-dependent oxidoreductase [Rhodospirillales bacterium]|nr:FAD-dependent oxidoreductase [Rhodospirillales bacterium]
MAAAHAALGWRVSLVEAARVAGREDPDLVDGLRMALSAQGVRMNEGIAVTSAAPGPRLLLAGDTELEGTHLLVSVGRQPNLEGLGLEASGIRASARGIATDRGLRSLSNRRVFAVGDIADPVGLGPRYFTHVGSYHAGIVIRRVLFRLPARLDYTALPRVLYTEPELAQVGLTEAEARAAGDDVRSLRWPMTENHRAITEGDTRGLVKLVTTWRGRLLGAGILSRGAGEMIGAFTLAIARRMRISALAGMIVPYPTRSEAGKRAAGEFFAPALFSDRMRRIAKFLTRLP